VRFRETFLIVVVVLARVGDQFLYTFSSPSTPLHRCQTLVLTDVRQALRPLHCPLIGTPLVRTREDLVEDPHLRLRVRFTACPSPTLIVVSLFVAISLARAQIQLRHRFTFRLSSSIQGARGCLLLGPSMTNHIVV
jgi:hypothetical protein